MADHNQRLVREVANTEIKVILRCWQRVGDDAEVKVEVTLGVMAQESGRFTKVMVLVIARESVVEQGFGMKKEAVAMTLATATLIVGDTAKRA